MNTHKHMQTPTLGASLLLCSLPLENNSDFSLDITTLQPIPTGH